MPKYKIVWEVENKKGINKGKLCIALHIEKGGGFVFTVIVLLLYQ